MGTPWRTVAVVAAALGLVTAACGSSGKSSTGTTIGASTQTTAGSGSAGATKSPYLLGFITSQTGELRPPTRVRFEVLRPASTH